MAAVNPPLLNHLRLNVERTSGIQVTCTRDCEVLSEELRAFDGRFPISVSTLRRFFKLIPKQGNFSQTTLNTLARYVGHPSYRAWESAHQRQPEATSLPSQKSGLGKVWLSPPEGDAERNEARPRTESRKVDAKWEWSQSEAHKDMERIIEKYSDPAHFHLTASEFERLKTSICRFYERGTFDVALWMRLVKHAHLVRFLIEQFPPLDFLNSFGVEMVNSYLQVAKSPSEVLYGKGLLAAGMVAQGAPWSSVAPLLPAQTALNPGCHPLIQSRNLGIQLLLNSDSQSGKTAPFPQAKELIMKGLLQDRNIWPRWAHQSCYFAFNMADWAVLSGDQEVVEAVDTNIEAFRTQQDWYNRDPAIDIILSVRQVWNGITLGHRENAKHLLKSIEWPMKESFQSRTLGLWYHGAMHALELAEPDLCMAHVQHQANLTGYKGFSRRIVTLVQQWGHHPQKK